MYCTSKTPSTIARLASEAHLIFFFAFSAAGKNADLVAVTTR